MSILVSMMCIMGEEERLARFMGLQFLTRANFKTLCLCSKSGALLQTPVIEAVPPGLQEGVFEVRKVGLPSRKRQGRGIGSFAR